MGAGCSRELIERWPKDEKGEPVLPAFLASSSQKDMGDAVLIGMLESLGVPCLRRFPHYGGFGKLVLGISAEGVDIFVPETMLEYARALMEGVPEDEEL